VLQVDHFCPPLPLAARHPGMSKAERRDMATHLGWANWYLRKPNSKLPDFRKNWVLNGFNTLKMIKLCGTTWISGNLRGSDDGLRTNNGHALRQHRVTVLHDYLHSQPEQCKVLRFQAAQL